MLDVCPKCHGKWLDEGELERLVLAGTKVRTTASALSSAMEAVERPTFFQVEGADLQVECPRCRTTMEKVRFESGGAELTADRCATCKGFWLDAGETGALFVFLEERLPVRRAVWVLAIVGIGLIAAYWFLG
jgi:Zn-finger nucleic acid-binding protein